MDIPQHQSAYVGYEAIDLKLSSLLSEGLIDERQYAQSWSVLSGLTCHVGTSKIKPGQPRTGYVLPERFETITMELEQTELDGMRVILSGGLTRAVIRAFSYMNRKG
ncbi:hypothetical protein [Pseudomonas veronii]|uniref:hypothetical protein n=1 Tax=Pseudomonas veronii TaxID=76761 RepID=UPI0021BF13E1|nr:hypothetical protein [Pseudomonas veronii]MCT9827404.1 hypothetical protein [Pseudomonas veronii]